MSKKHSYTQEQIQEMRDWIADCGGAESPFFDADELTDLEVISGINRHYDGGLRQFFIDLNTYTIKEVNCHEQE